MHAVIRSYTGAGAKELFDLLLANRSEVESLIRSATGFVSYHALRTEQGGSTITICQDKAGTDESVRLAGDWVRNHTADLPGIQPPTITEGPVVIHI
ncbi:hypothetical protein [Geminicoccus roseus]|uniref:hypothetical protein n=1 Tax=Geminicoccus roseus TaxID=404900 RepID=UPI00041E3DAD|nr:hypothetical protein [Geminicoccus roseus]